MPVVIVCCLLTMLATAAFLGLQGGALDRLLVSGAHTLVHALRNPAPTALPDNVIAFVRPAEAPKNLHRAFLGHLHHTLVKCLALADIGRMDPSEHLRLKLRQRLKVKSVAHRNGIANGKGSRIDDADDVAGIGHIYRVPLLRN